MPEVMKRVQAVKAFAAGQPEPAHAEAGRDADAVSCREHADNNRISCCPRSRPSAALHPFRLRAAIHAVQQPCEDRAGRTMLYHFGILSSTMHNAWVRYTCGR
jgi:hypothetical protein